MREKCWLKQSSHMFAACINKNMLHTFKTLTKQICATLHTISGKFGNAA